MFFLRAQRFTFMIFICCLFAYSNHFNSHCTQTHILLTLFCFILVCLFWLNFVYNFEKKKKNLVLLFFSYGNYVVATTVRLSIIALNLHGYRSVVISFTCNDQWIYMHKISMDLSERDVFAMNSCSTSNIFNALEMVMHCLRLPFVLYIVSVFWCFWQDAEMKWKCSIELTVLFFSFFFLCMSNNNNWNESINQPDNILIQQFSQIAAIPNCLHCQSNWNSFNAAVIKIATAKIHDQITLMQPNWIQWQWQWTNIWSIAK